MHKLVQLLVLGAVHESRKLLVLVRNHVTRAISDYVQAVSQKPEMKPFEQLIYPNKSSATKRTDF